MHIIIKVKQKMKNYSIQNILILPSNCPGNIPLITNGEFGPEKIFFTIPLVSDSRPGPNMAIFGVLNPR